MSLSTQQLRELDKRHIWHPFTPMKLWNESDPLVITDADGMYLIDSDGNRYLDGVSSLWCNVHGHRVPKVDEAIRTQLDQVFSQRDARADQRARDHSGGSIDEIVPPGLTKIFYSDSGATATEIAFKMAAQYWFNIGKSDKNEFVGFTEAYHGDTVGAMSIGRMPAFHRPYFPMLFKVHFAPISLQKLEQILLEHGSRIAAVCIEPIVQGAAVCSSNRRVFFAPFAICARAMTC